VSRRWIAYFNIKPVCNAIVKPSGETVLEKFKLRFDNEKRVFSGEVSMELNVKDESEARRILADHIEKELLLYLILTTNCGIEFNPGDMSLRYEEAGTIGVVVSNVAKVHVVAEVSKNPEDFKRELMRYLDRIKRLDDVKREWLLRALKFWNKGAVDHDPVDRFIYFYIALEILVKRILGYNDLNSHVIDEIGKKYGTHFVYEVDEKKRSVNEIRNHLLHGGATSAEKVRVLDKAVEEASKISDRFRGDVLNLIKKLLSNDTNVYGNIE